MSVFGDPYAIFEQDRLMSGEIRWTALGIVDDESVVAVAHLVGETDNDDMIRIILARPADRKERKRYGKHRQENAG